ncbi:MAG TPA: hypothetical protein VHY22_03940 [Chthoniobacteraceae bacterium]|jgi:hypothetical protein|nr:hypothetical protein [Chthoniobacteraceae bacterium]
MLKALHLWLPAYLRRKPHKQLRETHLLICVCDHFEPLHEGSKAEALARIRRWQVEFPRLASQFRDSSGTSPAHTFFYPVEQYDPDLIEAIAGICRATHCETEVHLHHHNDSAAGLAAKLEQGKRDLDRHGLLSTGPQGAIRFGFIHGNWALDNSRPGGGNCGVCNELNVLRQAGCYADFTMPSAPDPCQTAIINSIYYATPGERPKSHDRGRPARAGITDPAGFLLVQGPLGLNWRWRKWGVLPRIENGDLTPRNPPTADRLRLWRKLGVHVQGRPEWLFAKLHTHGGVPRNMDMLLGDPMRQFHRALADSAAADPGFHFHYVTARELVNIVHAAEAGKTGNPAAYRDFRYQTRTPSCAT